MTGFFQAMKAKALCPIEFNCIIRATSLYKAFDDLDFYYVVKLNPSPATLLPVVQDLLRAFKLSVPECISVLEEG